MSDQLDDNSSVHSSEDDNAYVAVSGNNAVPVVTISTHKDQSEHKVAPLPPPPGHRYRYTTWYDLRSNKVKGTELRNPRVRKGPEIKEMIFYTLTDERGRPIHHDVKGTKRMVYEKKIEDWENCTDVNLSYQELGHDYQMENFLRILKRIMRAERIQLVDNEIKQLLKISFPRCRELNLRQNFFSKFKDLPKCPALEVLILSDNSITSLDDLHLLSAYPLRSLDLRRNPISFTPNYRQKVFYILPKLKELDGVPQLSSDLDYEPPVGSTCVIS
ncbi:acidic leucine-rich nuclear phosphoprotein 32-related protein-like [Amphiura filiformis]|uniref:acidic leucine-rich nuclear phosphoprotein 32-related protein-like n=1 Tax=Amphiura filiformis TaxID=82378 RepID=UPI003B21917F